MDQAPANSPRGEYCILVDWLIDWLIDFEKKMEGYSFLRKKRPPLFWAGGFCQGRLHHSGCPIKPLQNGHSDRAQDTEQELFEGGKSQVIC